jgi:hypothetical protein
MKRDYYEVEWPITDKDFPTQNGDIEIIRDTLSNPKDILTNFGPMSAYDVLVKLNDVIGTENITKALAEINQYGTKAGKEEMDKMLMEYWSNSGE